MKLGPQLIASCEGKSNKEMHTMYMKVPASNVIERMACNEHEIPVVMPELGPVAVAGPSGHMSVQQHLLVAVSAALQLPVQQYWFTLSHPTPCPQHVMLRRLRQLGMLQYEPPCLWLHYISSVCCRDKIAHTLCTNLPLQGVPRQCLMCTDVY